MENSGWFGNFVSSHLSHLDLQAMEEAKALVSQYVQVD